MEQAICIVIILILDLILGDPEWLIHPVVVMGRVISEAESFLREKLPRTPEGEFWAGLILAFALPAVTFLLSFFLISFAYFIWAPLGWLLQIFWGYQAIAVRDMLKEAEGVRVAVREGDIKKARTAVSRIVGRDTEALDISGVIRACVETVAESFCDGYLAPIFYFAIGGAPLALCYKAINTMDSMIGYKNEIYMHFGRAAARLDDAANFIPSRIGAFILMAAAALLGYDEKAAYNIWKRDRKKSASPNSGQCEAVMAGACHIRLLGPAYYFGKLFDKSYIGDDIRPVEEYDIKRAENMYMAGAVIAAGALFLLQILKTVL